MQQPADSRRTNLTLLIVAGSFLFGSVTYGCVLWYVLSGRVGVQAVPLSPILRGAFFVVAGLGLVGAIVWTRLRLIPAADAGDGRPRSPEELAGFQRDVVIALALAESGVVAGFVSSFMAGSLRDYFYTGIPCVAVMLLVVAPQIFRFLNRP